MPPRLAASTGEAAADTTTVAVAPVVLPAESFDALIDCVQEADREQTTMTGERGAARACRTRKRCERVPAK